jgi:hypothetical protein
MELLRRIDLPRILDGAAQTLCPLSDALHQRAPPLAKSCPGNGHRHLFEASAQLGSFYAAKPFEHRRPASITLRDHVATNVLERITGDPGPPCELIQNLDGHVHFADRAEGLGDAPDLPLGLSPDLGVGREDRNRFPEPPGRDPGLVHPRVVAGNGGGQVTLQVAGPSAQ